ncbi:MAG: HD domain-containing protein, partial [Limnochordia bacterium]
MLVRDPIHGDIYLTEEETRVLDTAPMQRLRGIKQLGMAYLVYPGCMHTRFEHCLGTLAMAQRILEALMRNGYRISQEEQCLVRMSALVHDISHIPFGHTFEDERAIFPRHDSKERVMSFLERGDLQTLLGKYGLLQHVLSIILRQPNSPFAPWVGEIVSSTLDADLLDYLRRDAYYSGLSQTYDDRIIDHFVICDGKLAINMQKHGMDRPDIRSEILHLLRMRYVLTERVYYHHTKVVAGAMLSKALELAKVDVRDLYSLGDWQLLDYLLQVSRYKGIPGVKRLVKRLTSRDLLKRAYVISLATVSPRKQAHLISLYSHPRGIRLKTEREIARSLALEEDEVIIYCPPKT